MYRVVICDDEATSLQINQILTEQVLEEDGIEYEITTFEDMRVMTEALADERAEYPSGHPGGRCISQQTAAYIWTAMRIICKRKAAVRA